MRILRYYWIVVRVKGDTQDIRTFRTLASNACAAYANCREFYNQELGIGNFNVVSCSTVDSEHDSMIGDNYNG